MGSWQLRVGAVQLCSTEDLASNLATCHTLSGQAVAEGAQLIVLPENFALLGKTERDKLQAAEVLDGGGPIVNTLREIATRHGVWLVGGGFPERVAGDDRRTYNTAVVIAPNGELVARYRKIHLFDVDIPGTTVHESDATAPGKELVTADIAGVRCGVTICYDVRFPELYRALVKDCGAEVLLVPSAFTAHTGAAHWHLLLRARAIEDQAWVVAPAQWGRHNAKRESFGHTLVVDPWGTIVAESASGNSVVVTTLDGATVERRRTQMPCLSHAVLWHPR